MSIMSLGQTTLPLNRSTWNNTPTGWTDTPLDNYLTTFACSGNNGAKFDTTGDSKIVNFNVSPNQLTLVVKSNTTTSSSLLVEESANGVSYTTVVNLSGSANLPTTCTTKGPYTLNPASRYVRWTFTKGSSNMTMDDVSISALPSSNYTVTYDGAGNTGGSVPLDSNSPYNAGATVTVMDNTNGLTKTGYIFNGWNTLMNGTGTSYVAGNTFNISTNTTLYAQWLPFTCIPVNISTVMPASGPVGTQVTITASSGSLTGATATFNGITAPVISSSDSQLVIKIPSGATTGNLIITDSQPCASTSIAFTVINEDKTSCQGTSLITDLFISEVTDASSGSLSYVEIYNATTSTINLNNYAVRFTNFNATLGDSNPGTDVDLPLTGSLAPGGKFIFATSVGSGCANPGADGSLANQTGVHSGINNNDLVSLLKTGTVIDVWGVASDTRFWIRDAGFGDEGYDFERKNTVNAPSTVFNINDWVITDWDTCSDDYSNIATYVTATTSPSITVQPTISLTCSSTSITLSVTATEGFAGGNPLAYQWYEVAPNTDNWTALVNGGVYSGTTTNTLNITSIAALEGYQYYCQVRENEATCYVATTASIINTDATTWNGTAWSNGEPTLSKKAILNGNYNTTTHGNIDACSLTVNLGLTATITSGHYFNIQNDVTVLGTLDILNNGSLVQISDSGINTGNISMKRDTNIRKLDYVFWSSPVSAFSVLNVSPLTPSNLIWQWETTTGNPNSGWGSWINANENMVAGKGYTVRGPNNFTTTSQIYTANFIGVPNNGIITKSIARGVYQGNDYTGNNGIIITQNDDDWNLVGNPYPSSIDAMDFLEANANIEGFINIWTHETLPSTSVSNPFYNSYVYNYSASDYITYNATGPSTQDGFDGKIASAQSFFVNMVDGGSDISQSILFNNSMRNKMYNNSQFFKNENTSNGEKNRIWLDLISTSNTVNRILIGYVEGATLNRDRLFDAITKVGNNQNFYSVIDENPFKIQGRTVPFDSNDQVKLGMKLVASGNYSIAISSVDGLFSNANQMIYLEDKQLGIIHNLRQSPYTFTNDSGRIDNRFILRYTNSLLDNSEFDLSESNVVIYPSNTFIVINSKQNKIKEYIIYDALGRTLSSMNKVNSDKSIVNSIERNNQVLIVKVTLENGFIITKKIIF